MAGHLAFLRWLACFFFGSESAFERHSECIGKSSASGLEEEGFSEDILEDIGSSGRTADALPLLRMLPSGCAASWSREEKLAGRAARELM